MNTPSLSSFVLKWSTLAALLGCACLRAAEPTVAPATNSPVVVVPKSLFVDEAANGKDPFFPGSTRRQEAAATTATTNNVVAPTTFLSQLALKGISGTKGQLLAIINNATLAVGETGDVKVGGRTVKVRCREIRDRSVLIELEGGGEVKELKLRDGI